MHSIDVEPLIDCIADGQVLAIVGKDLLRSKVNGIQIGLEEFVCRRVAERLGLPTRAETINELVIAFPNDLDEQRLINAVRDAQTDGSFPLPAGLCALAKISKLRAFVSTTSDNLLVRALNEHRFGNQPRTVVEAFYPQCDNADVSDAFPSLQNSNTGVYHLFGRAQSLPGSFVMTDAELLGFLHDLHAAKSTRLPRLVRLLKERSLLILGTGFPDWVMRVFLRFAKDAGLFEMQRRASDFIADGRAMADTGFVNFIDSFAPRKTYLFERTDVTEFVLKLADAWERKFPDTSGHVTQMPPPSIIPRQIFVSYASEDRPFARRICDRLVEAGLTVWFDRDELLNTPGDYDLRICNAIEQSVLFIPVLSRNSVNPDTAGRYLVGEWFEAAKKIKRFHGYEDKPVLPLLVDDLPRGVASESIERSFYGKLQIEKAPGGNLDSDLVEKLSAFVARYWKR